jgi:hypothetical protein
MNGLHEHFHRKLALAWHEKRLCNAQVEAQSLRMPLRFLARLRQLLEAPAPVAAPAPAAEGVPLLNGAAEPPSSVLAPLNGAAAVQQGEEHAMTQSRHASGAAASTSGAAAQQAPASALNGSQQQAGAQAALLLQPPNGSGDAGTAEDAALAAAVQEIQNRRCPPLGRFGHGTAYNVRVTKKARPLPFSIKASTSFCCLLPCTRTSLFLSPLARHEL